ncbi:unnamed protein product [Owenia fusiformis]|uniref:Uncharacterized protein n=1 Tax=Owenia fusiformis TaxID=6347 RepID=A0A8J1TJ55_OWEFU|nr:unnamed protein product [Owenia fusiformis]
MEFVFGEFSDDFDIASLSSAESIPACTSPNSLAPPPKPPRIFHESSLEFSRSNSNSFDEDNEPKAAAQLGTTENVVDDSAEKKTENNLDDNDDSDEVQFKFSDEDFKVIDDDNELDEHLNEEPDPDHPKDIATVEDKDHEKELDISVKVDDDMTVAGDSNINKVVQNQQQGGDKVMKSPTKTLKDLSKLNKDKAQALRKKISKSIFALKQSSAMFKPKTTILKCDVGTSMQNDALDEEETENEKVEETSEIPENPQNELDNGNLDDKRIIEDVRMV